MKSGFVIGDRGLGAASDTHPDWMAANATASSHLIAGASAIGQMHLRNGTPRDDAFVIRSAGSWIAVAVADGVGSKPLSRFGATYVVESLTTQLLNQIGSPIKISTADEKAAQGNFQGDFFTTDNQSHKTFQPRMITNKKKPNLISQLSLKLGMKQWTEIIESLDLSIQEVPLKDFQQAASSGWWYADSSKKGLPKNALVSSNDMGDLENDFSQSPKKSLDKMMRKAYRKTFEGLMKQTQYLELSINELSCTALALLYNLEDTSGVAGQIGDGAILNLHKLGYVKEITNPPETDDPQKTYTINRSDFEDYLSIELINHIPDDPIQAIYLMTDGVAADLVYSPDEQIVVDWAQKVDQNLRSSQHSEQAAIGMLNWLSTYQVKGSWDDRTLVVITKQG